MTKQNKNKTRYGVFYVSNGKWVGPYQDATFTEYSLNRNPIKGYIRDCANYVLKSRIKLLPVQS